jgi:hypothetical protein
MPPDKVIDDAIKNVRTFLLELDAPLNEYLPYVNVCRVLFHITSKEIEDEEDSKIVGVIGKILAFIVGSISMLNLIKEVFTKGDAKNTKINDNAQVMNNEYNAIKTEIENIAKSTLSDREKWMKIESYLVKEAAVKSDQSIEAIQEVIHDQNFDSTSEASNIISKASNIMIQPLIEEVNKGGRRTKSRKFRTKSRVRTKSRKFRTKSRKYKLRRL